jgi:hypothetical protein
MWNRCAGVSETDRKRRFFKGAKGAGQQSVATGPGMRRLPLATPAESGPEIPICGEISARPHADDHPSSVILHAIALGLECSQTTGVLASTPPDYRLRTFP